MDVLKTQADKMVYRGAYDFYMRAGVIESFENHLDRENYDLGRDRARAMTSMAPLKLLNPQEVSQFCLAIVKKIREENAVDSAPVNDSAHAPERDLNH